MQHSFPIHLFFKKDILYQFRNNKIKMKFSIVFLALAALANAIPVVEGEGALLKPSGPFPSGEPHHHHPHPKPSGPHGAKRE